jgi:copper transport protein
VHTSSRLRVIATTFAAIAVVATPAILFAHARLVRSAPSADATLTEAPTSLKLWFSERPELRFSTLRLVDSAGTAVPLGAVAKIAGDAMALTAPISAPIANGRYTVQWRTAADDGHATSGSFAFVVAVPGLPAPVVSSDTSAARPRRVPNTVVEPAATSNMSAAVRWAELVAVLTLIGTMVFMVFVVPRAQLPADVAREAGDRARRLGNAVLFLFVVTTFWRLSGQADLIPSAATARMAAMTTVVRETGWGAGWLVGAAGAVIAAIGLMFARTARIGWFVAGIGAVGIVFSQGLTGHPAVARSVPFAAAVDVAHVLGAGGWVGGLAALILCGLAATQRAEATTGVRLSQQLVRAYHRSAVECVAIVLVTAFAAIGVAWFRLGQPTVFWTSAYGRVLLVKMAFAAVLLGFGWFHWRTAVIPDWTDDTGFRFKRSVALELAVGAGIVGVTVILLSTGPSRS